jgi:transposase
MGSTRRRFTEEYKAQAVSFVIDDQRPVAEVARNIGVHEMTLGKWVKKAKGFGEATGKPLEDSERAELERLRAENAELKMQVEFAKKVAPSSTGRCNGCGEFISGCDVVEGFPWASVEFLGDGVEVLLAVA